MAGSADRAINFPLRVRGVSEVERDLKKVGDAGEETFDKVRKSANGANQEISEYTARLKRVQAAAKQAFDAHPDVQVARRLEPQGYQSSRNKFILDAVEAEKKLIQQGLPESTAMWEQASGAATGYATSLAGVTAAATVVGSAIGLAAKITLDGLEAWQEHEQVLTAFEASLRLAGNQSEATAGQIESMAERVVDATLQTEESALSAAQQLATIPGITAEGLEAALDASARLADALGQDVASVVNDITRPAIQALVEGDLEGFYKATKDKLSPSLQKLVLDLAEAGKTADAQRALIEGLRDAAGDGPNGLTSATNRLSDAWDRFKRSIGEEFSGPAASALDFLSSKLDNLRGNMERTGITWSNLLAGTLIPGIGGGLLGTLLGSKPAAAPAVPAPEPGARVGGALARLSSANERSAARELEKRYGGTSDKKTKGGSGSGKSAAEREAEANQRAAEQARNAADRVSASNDKVVESYALRAQEAEAKIGLEGAALEAVERQQRVETAVRRISTDEIEKQVEARRKEAVAAGKQFDEAKATAEATAAVEAKSTAVRDLAERYEDANEQLAEFRKNQQIAARILEELKTPIDKVSDAIDDAIVSLRGHHITVGEFDARMKQLAYDMADARLEMDKSRQAWVGFGSDVGRSLSDIALNGGSARDILQDLIRLPLERLLYQTVEQPVANFVDDIFGVNRDKNAAQELSKLPTGDRIAGASVQVLDGASASAAASVTNLANAANSASVALGGAPIALENPLHKLAADTDATSQAFGELIPLTGQFGGTIGQVIAMLSAVGGGSSGVGGLISGLGSLVGGVAGGGGGLNLDIGPIAGLDAGGAIGGIPKLYASGTDRVPIDRPFFVGENGRELMYWDGAGRLSVKSNQDTRRYLSETSSGGPTVINNITIPERADPRRTASGIARATQGAISRSARKGLATPPERF